MASLATRMQLFQSYCTGWSLASPYSLYAVLSLLRTLSSGEARTFLSSLLGMGEEFEKEDECIQTGDFTSQNLLATHSSMRCHAPLPKGTKHMSYTDPGAMVESVNAWCAEVTQGKITEALQNMSGGEEAILVNACYFLGKWASPFSKQETRPMAFHTELGATSFLMFMHQKRLMEYHDDEVYVGVTLPYEDGLHEMVVMVPRAGHVVAELEDVATWPAPGSGEMDKKVELYLPRFATRARVPVLKWLHSTFPECKAYFSKLHSPQFREVLNVADIVQEVGIEVDEEGTVASAVSYVSMNRAVSMDPVVWCNRPFRYLVRHRDGTPLFTGVFSGEGGEVHVPEVPVEVHVPEVPVEVAHVREKEVKGRYVAQF